MSQDNTPLKAEGLTILDTQALHLVGHVFCNAKVLLCASHHASNMEVYCSIPMHTAWLCISGWCSSIQSRQCDNVNIECMLLHILENSLCNMLVCRETAAYRILRLWTCLWRQLLQVSSERSQTCLTILISSKSAFLVS